MNATRFETESEKRGTETEINISMQKTMECKRIDYPLHLAFITFCSLHFCDDSLFRSLAGQLSLSLLTMLRTK